MAVLCCVPRHDAATLNRILLKCCQLSKHFRSLLLQDVDWQSAGVPSLQCAWQDLFQRVANPLRGAHWCGRPPMLIRPPFPWQGDWAGVSRAAAHPSAEVINKAASHSATNPPPPPLSAAVPNTANRQPDASQSLHDLGKV